MNEASICFALGEGSTFLGGSLTAATEVSKSSHLGSATVLCVYILPSMITGIQSGPEFSTTPSQGTECADCKGPRGISRILVCGIRHFVHVHGGMENTSHNRARMEKLPQELVSLMLAAVNDTLGWPVLPFVCRQWGGTTELSGPGEVKDYADQLAQKGLLACSNGPARMAAPGMSGPVPRQQKEATWRCFNGPTRMAAPGMKHLCMAAGGGHLEVLQWARQNGCPWDEQTCAHGSRRRPPGGASMGPPEWLPLG